MRLVFHIGLQKTGTSTFQDTLRQNRDSLKNHCIVSYEGMSEACRKPGQSYCQHDDDNYKITFRRRLVGTKKHFLNSGMKFGIMSDENLFCRVPRQGTRSIEDFYAKGIDVLHGVFKDQDVKYIITTRDMGAWKISMYKQLVKRAGLTSSFKDWESQVQIPKDWSFLKRKLNKKFGGLITYYDVETEFKSRKVGERILVEAGVTPEELANISWAKAVNHALPAPAVKAMLAVNSLNISERSKIRISEIIEQNINLEKPNQCS